jgi:hypothetical protein
MNKRITHNEITGKLGEAGISEVFRARGTVLNPGMGYDVLRDGRKFLLVKTGESARLSLTLPGNWS